MQRHEKVARDEVLPHPVDLDSTGLAPNRKGIVTTKGKAGRPKPPKRVNLKNIKTNYLTNSPEYRFYEQWDKRGKYLSNQFESKIQSKVRDVATKQSGKTYYKMQMDDPTQKLKQMEDRQRCKNPSDPQNKGMKREEKNPKKMIDQEDKVKKLEAVRGSGEDKPDLSQMPLYPLDVEKDVLDDFTTVLIGRRRSGKTWAQRWLLYHLRHRYPFGIVITGTRLNNFWSQYVPEEFIHDIEDISEVLDECMARQTYLEAQPDLGIDSRMFVILDDVMSDKYRIRFSTALSNLWTNGRHLKIGVFITLQDPKGIGPDLRENTDMCIIFRVYEGGRKKVIYEEWLSYFNALYCAPFFWKHTGLLDPDTGERFEETRETTDQDRAKMIPQAIAILQAKNTDNLQGVFKKVVAEDPGPFVLGNPDYYKAGAFGNYKLIQGTDRRYRKMRVDKPKKGKKSKNKKKKDFSSSSDSSSSA